MTLIPNDVRARARRGEYLTPEEVAALLRVSQDTIYRQIRSGALAAERIGRQYRILAQTVADCLLRHQQQDRAPHRARSCRA